MRSSLPLRLLVPASLVLLVATLATLHTAGRSGERSGARSTARLALATRVGVRRRLRSRDRPALSQPTGDGETLDRGEWTAFAKGYDTWRESARFPEMSRAVYLVNGTAPEQAARKYDPEAHAFVAASWPALLGR